MEHLKQALVVIIILAVAAGIYFIASPSQEAEPDLILEEEMQIIAQDLQVPWAMDFLPDGRLIFTEREGNVKIVQDGNVVELAAISEVSASGEGGLHGIAVDPEFEANGFIYLYYTSDEDNRVVRYNFSLEGLSDRNVLVSGIPKSQIHNGGRIKFGPDEYLYITTGDSANPSSAQDIDSLAGKILRINKDGSIPQDNPFGNAIYSYGHRNPQGIAWNPSTGEMYSSEHGPSSHDEINLIFSGKNYGWPEVLCDENSEEYQNAVRCYDEFTLAPSGIAFYGGDLYLAALRGTQVRKLTIEEGRVTGEEVFMDNLGRVREIIQKERYLYISTSNRDGRGSPKGDDDKIIRVKLDG